MQQVQEKPKIKKWLKWIGVFGFLVVCYQAFNIILALSKDFDWSFILYTVEVVLMVILVQVSISLWKRGSKDDER